MKLDHLLNGVGIGFAFKRFAGEPFFVGGGRDMFNLILLRYGEAGTEHFHHRIFVLGVDGVGSAYHHDEMDFQFEGFHALE